MVLSSGLPAPLSRPTSLAHMLTSTTSATASANSALCTVCPGWGEGRSGAGRCRGARGRAEPVGREAACYSLQLAIVLDPCTWSPLHLALERRVVFAALPAVRPLQIQHQGGRRRHLRAAGSGTGEGGLERTSVG